MTDLFPAMHLSAPAAVGSPGRVGAARPIPVAMDAFGDHGALAWPRTGVGRVASGLVQIACGVA
jgi:hypothetical protein